MSKNEPNRVFPGQFQDEEVLFTFKRHPVVMRKGLLVVMFTVLIGALIGMFMSRNAETIGSFFTQFFTPVGFCLAAGLAVLFYYWIGWHYSICIVTNQRFIKFTQKGIFKSRSVNDIPLERILSVNYEIRGMVETLLGFGTIIIQTLVGDFVVAKVGKPAQTQANIVSAIKESGVKLSEQTEVTSQS